MVGLAYYFIDSGLHLAAGGATFATFPGVLAGLIVLVYFYRSQRSLRHQMLSEQNEEAPIERTSAVIKRLFALAIPGFHGQYYVAYGIFNRYVHRSKRLMDIGYYLHEATTQFGYLTGMATSLIGLPIILTTALAASLVPAVSEAHATENKGRIIERASTAMKIANLFAIPACIGLCVLATPISQLIMQRPMQVPLLP